MTTDGETSPPVQLAWSDPWILTGLLFARAPGLWVEAWSLIEHMGYHVDAPPTPDQVRFGLPRLGATGLVETRIDPATGLQVRATERARVLLDALPRGLDHETYEARIAAAIGAPTRQDRRLDDRSLGPVPGLDTVVTADDLGFFDNSGDADSYLSEPPDEETLERLNEMLDLLLEEGARLADGPVGSLEEDASWWERSVLQEFRFLAELGFRVRDVLRHFRGEAVTYQGPRCSVLFNHEPETGSGSALVWYPQHPDPERPSILIEELLGMPLGQSAWPDDPDAGRAQLEADIRHWAAGLRGLGTTWLEPPGTTRRDEMLSPATASQGAGVDPALPERWDPRMIRDQPEVTEEEVAWESQVLRDFAFLHGWGFAIGSVSYRQPSDILGVDVDTIRYEGSHAWVRLELAPSSQTVRATILSPPFAWPGSVPLEVLFFEQGLSQHLPDTEEPARDMASIVAAWADGLRKVGPACLRLPAGEAFPGADLADDAIECVFERDRPSSLDGDVRAVPDADAWWWFLVEEGRARLGASGYLAAGPPHTHGPVTVFELTDASGGVLLLAHDRDADTMRAEMWTTRDRGLVLDRFDPPLSADASGGLPRGRHEIIGAYRRWIDHLAG